MHRDSSARKAGTKGAGMLFPRGCGRRGFGRRESAGEGAFPIVEAGGRAARHAALETNALDGGEEERGDVGHGRGAFAGDAVVREHVPKFAEGVVDIGGGAKFTGERGEFIADMLGFEDAAFFASVEEAKKRMRTVAKHGAATIVGSAIVAAIGIGDAR